MHSADALASHWPGVQKLDKNRTGTYNRVGFGEAAARSRATAGASSTGGPRPGQVVTSRMKMVPQMIENIKSAPGHKGLGAPRSGGSARRERLSAGGPHVQARGTWRSRVAPSFILGPFILGPFILGRGDDPEARRSSRRDRRGRREMAPLRLENIDFAPGNGMASEALTHKIVAQLAQIRGVRPRQINALAEKSALHFW